MVFSICFLIAIQVATRQDIMLVVRKVPFAPPNINFAVHQTTAPHFLAPASVLRDSLHHFSSSAVHGKEFSLTVPRTSTSPIAVAAHTTTPIGPTQKAKVDSTWSMNGFVWPSHKPAPVELTRRSADLYALRVLLRGEGYIELFFPNSAAMPFCEGVSDKLYEDSTDVIVDLNIEFKKDSVTVPVQEDQAVEFCKEVRAREQGQGSSPTAISSSSAANVRETKVPQSTVGNDDGAEVTSKKPSKSNMRSTPTPTPGMTSVIVPTPKAALSQDPAGAHATEEYLSSETPKLTAPPLSLTGETSAARSPMATASAINSVNPSSMPAANNTFTPDPEDLPGTDEDVPLQDPEDNSGTLAPSVSSETPTPSRSSVASPPKPLASKPPVQSAPPDSRGSDSAPSENTDEIGHKSMFASENNMVSPIDSTITPPSTSLEADVLFQEVGHQSNTPHLSESSINSWHNYPYSYMETVGPTGAAISARALENAGAPKPMVMGMGLWKTSKWGTLTQLFQRRGNNHATAFETGMNDEGEQLGEHPDEMVGGDKEDEHNVELSPLPTTLSTSRKLAKQRLHTSSPQAVPTRSKPAECSHLVKPSPTPSPGDDAAESAPAPPIIDDDYTTLSTNSAYTPSNTHNDPAKSRRQVSLPHYTSLLNANHRSRNNILLLAQSHACKSTTPSSSHPRPHQQTDLFHRHLLKCRVTTLL
ncbi:hypothetical protein EK21DRAFT_91880 [Setomelanomma holmii]|uniref:Uncharacterized protein n=1 Tax=Setomelanomma holmii TaxID=210430 RepID=A0A9P4LIW2_9PLEO|nr:hypothetical protein EK21DRAFT_91880 [Setomelanomma holmii]